MFEDLISFIRDLYNTNDYIPLHAPCFSDLEKKYLFDAIDSTYVSSVGKYVEEFEFKICDFTGSKHAIATVNGTAALHTALKLSGVDTGDEVITQSFTFVATCNAIRYCNAEPVFVDVNQETLGLCPKSMLSFLEERCEVRDDGFCWNKITNRIIRACLPMHTFGFPAELKQISDICDKYNIVLVEDAAESTGSIYNDKHTGTLGMLAAMSFNGNKIITTGGGGMILTDDDEISVKARHITTTAKIPHQWIIAHDQTGYNYRMPNINAALGVAQIEKLPFFIEKKREIAQKYQTWVQENNTLFINEPKNTRANYWLNTIVTEDRNQRDIILYETNSQNVMTRPAWTPMHKLQIYNNCQRTELENTEWLYDRLVNVPSGLPCLYSRQYNE